jgi:hypothetical protein
MTSPLERLIREAREDLGRKGAPRVDWEEVDRKLFARIERDEERAARALRPAAKFAWAGGALALSAAAVAALVVGRTSDRRPLEASPAVAEEAAGNVVSVEGDGDLLVDGKPAAVGATLRVGDVVDVRGAARATVERPGKVTFALEHGARATVERVQGTLVLALERGGVEAQVVPVPRGEAFAVDVGHSRVAVHGTHLRVERQHETTASGASPKSDRVVVDLSEGVVSVGEAPRLGSTSGTLVTAPAHAEFSADDAQGTLDVTHDPARVRAAVALGASTVQARTVTATPAAATPHGDTEPRAASGLAATAHVEGRPTSGNVSAPATAADPNAEATLASTVRACFAARPSAANVTVSVSTTLRLALRDDGSVRSARFDPPVAPDVNACAAQSIYRTRFAHGGSAAVSIDIKEPSTSAP